MYIKNMWMLCCTLISCGDIVEYCTEMGCIDGFQMTLEPPITTHASYIFTVTLDGETITCEYALPFVEEGGEYGSCDGEGVWLTISGTALDASQHSIPEIYIPSNPSEVSIEITKDEEVLVRETVAPEYEEFAPNGKDCGPICYSAGITISIFE